MGFNSACDGENAEQQMFVQVLGGWASYNTHPAALQAYQIETPQMRNLFFH